MNDSYSALLVDGEREAMLEQLAASRTHLCELLACTVVVPDTPAGLRRLRRDAQEIAAVAEGMADLTLEVSRNDFRESRC